jgi:hypothetical protein
VPSYLNATGALPSFAKGKSPIADELRTLSDAVRRASTGMRGWVAQIPRNDLPGRCVSIVSAFHNLPDPHVEEEVAHYEDFQERGTSGKNTRLMIFVVTQVWQTEGLEPKLIGAGIEAVTEFDPRSTTSLRRALQTGLRSAPQAGDAVTRILCDSSRDGRNDLWGGSSRIGMLWADRSYGLLEARDFSAAYRMDGKTELTAKLPADVLAALRSFVVRY